MKWPFEQWLDIAVRLYGLTPSEFWQMSLYDWLCLMDHSLSRNEKNSPMLRSDFSKLSELFPDILQNG